MKRLLWGLPLTLLLGCPIYDEDCSSGQDCAPGFVCDDYRQRCVAIPGIPSCVRPEQCGLAETCTPDALCQPGSCDYHGCVAGYTCSIVDGVHACVAVASGQDAGPPPGEADAGALDASTSGDAAVTPELPDSGTPDASSDAG
ncbi:MAG TPA: hypothetical protein VFS67_04220 [Polyangiaceae bacterium]|nr:hypothetical protein [Polyangiaceae bacterium]